jgi:serine/threonine protein kinase
MGHVEICAVLKQCEEDTDLMDLEDDDDVVFELTDEYVAIKVKYYDKMESLRNQHAEEIAAMQLIGGKSSHVLGCRDVLHDDGTKTLNVISPYCPHGDLFQLLNDEEIPGLPEPQARHWFKQILLGLRVLRDLGICHRDLSPENVMMDHNHCMIIDLGMCLRVPYTDPTGGTTDISSGTGRRLFSPQGACGKLPYMPPEIYRNRQPFDGELADVWTAGTILFSMLTGIRSYERPHNSDPQFYWMTHGLETLMRDWNVTLSPEGLHLLRNLLQVNPRLRFTLDEALAHPWFDLPTKELDLSNP